MIFRQKASLIQSLILSVLITQMLGCTDFLMGKPKKQDFLEVKKESLTCLKNISTKIKIFLRSEASMEDVDQALGCLDQTLLEFQTRAVGNAEGNAFSTEDMFKIFDQFLHDAKISKEASTDLMKLKSALVGGSELQLTKLEIGQIRDLLQILRPELQQLRPFAHIFSFKKGNHQFSKEEIKTAFTQLGNSFNKLVAATRISRADYHFDDLKKLLLNLQIFNSESNNLIDLAGDVKNLLLGFENLQSSSDFQSFIFNVTELLRLYSLQSQGYVVFELKDAARVNDTVEFTEDILKILENSLQYKKTKMISADTIDPLIIKVAEKGYLPVSATAETVIQFYKIIMVRAFDAGIHGNPEAFTGLSKVHFLNIRRELSSFKIYLAAINSLSFPKLSDINATERIEIKEAQSRLKNYNFRDQLSALSNHTQSEQELILSAVDELRSEFLSARPVVYRYNKMVIAANQDIWKQSWQDLVGAVYVKFLARSLMIGWGNANESRLVQDAYITEAALIKWYSEFKQFGIEVKLFDPRSINSGAKSFQEANLFSYSADGNDKMSFSETVQYLNMLSTGGGQSLKELRLGLTKAGCNLLENDVFGFPWNNESCTYKEIRKNYRSYFNNLSYLVAFLDQLNDSQFLSYYEAVVGIARNDSNIHGKLESADLRNFLILEHYIEALYAVYDSDQNWVLSAAELRKAFPRFRTFATEFAYKTAKDKIDMFNSTAVKLLGYGCYTEVDLIRESFIYLTYKGTTPGITDLNVAPCLGSRPLIDFSGEIDRKAIINTFKILKDVLGF